MLSREARPIEQLNFLLLAIAQKFAFVRLMPSYYIQMLLYGVPVLYTVPAVMVNAMWQIAKQYR